MQGEDCVSKIEEFCAQLSRRKWEPQRRDPNSDLLFIFWAILVGIVFAQTLNARLQILSQVVVSCYVSTF